MLAYEIKTNEDGHDHVVISSLGNHEPLLSSQVYRGDMSAEHLVELLKKGGLDLHPVGSEYDQAASEVHPDAEQE